MIGAGIPYTLLDLKSTSIMLFQLSWSYFRNRLLAWAESGFLKTKLGTKCVTRPNTGGCHWDPGYCRTNLEAQTTSPKPKPVEKSPCGKFRVRTLELYFLYTILHTVPYHIVW